jgi:hypothetical protein
MGLPTSPADLGLPTNPGEFLQSQGLPTSPADMFGGGMNGGDAGGGAMPAEAPAAPEPPTPIAMEAVPGEKLSDDDVIDMMTSGEDE